MILEETQEQIKKSFYHAIDQYFEYADPDDDKEMEDVKERVIDKINDEFFYYNNSWIDLDGSDEDFEKGKAEILDFIRTL